MEIATGVGEILVAAGLTCATLSVFMVRVAEAGVEMSASGRVDLMPAVIVTGLAVVAVDAYLTIDGMLRVSGKK